MQRLCVFPPRSTSYALRFALLITAAAALLGLPRAAHAAATVTVTNTMPGGPGSLTEAINTVDDGGTINFDRTAWGIITPSPSLNAAVFIQNKSVTISGPGAELLTISGGNSQRVLEVSGSGHTVTISGLSIMSGAATDGAGVYVDSGTLNLSRVIIRNNHASNSGGGLFNAGMANLTDVVVGFNTADSISGGIYNANTLTLTKVTIRNNTATNSYAGGLHNNVGASAVLTNVTVSGNTSKVDPGGISNSGAVILTNSTIAYNNNVAVAPSGIGNYHTVAISSTIVANNVGGNCGGTTAPTSNGHNLEDGTSCGFANTGDLNTNPQLVALVDNGGFAPTHALSGGSPAIDQIPAGTNGCGTVVATDQRGGARPVNSNCDIGAFEYGEAPTLTSINPTSVDVLGPTFTLTLTGTNFIQDAYAQWGGPPGASLLTYFVSSTSLTATVPSQYLNTSGGIAISVKNPSAGDGSSGLQTLTVNKLYQIITFDPLPNRAINESPFTVSATATSGLAVKFTDTGWPWSCVVHDNTVTLLSMGNCTVVASQAGNSIYNAAPYVARTFMIGQGHLYLPLTLK